MVTGDDLLTAKAIATECGILTDEPADTAILAKDFASMSEAQREKIAENIVVRIIMFLLTLLLFTENLQRIYTCLITKKPYFF